MAAPRTFDALADLPLTIEDYRLEARWADTTSGFTRVSTVIHLRGAGDEGVGEDVTYDAPDHMALHAAGAVLPLAGGHTLGSFSARLDELPVFPAPPAREASRNHRRWGFESAALDLALRQAGLRLADVLHREPRPLTFVVSLRLPEPSSADPVRAWLARDPALRFKLDPTAAWSPSVVADLAETRAVDTVDLKGAYEGTVVEAPPDPDLYRMVAEGLPEAWIEDPRLTPETDAVLAPHRARITWDAAIHSVSDIRALPFPPRMLNIKPSRFGTVAGLMDAYDHMAAAGIRGYGGGQFELGPGRGQAQYLASLFHPDAPNDVAPSAYNDPMPPRALPSTPLAPAPAASGFRWSAP